MFTFDRKRNSKRIIVEKSQGWSASEENPEYANPVNAMRQPRPGKRLNGRQGGIQREMRRKYP